MDEVQNKDSSNLRPSPKIFKEEFLDELSEYQILKKHISSEC
jgi:hypothetical protein